MYRNNRSLRTQEHSACLMIPFVFITGDQSPLENRVLLRLLLVQLFGSECGYKESCKNEHLGTDGRYIKATL